MSIEPEQNPQQKLDVQKDISVKKSGKKKKKKSSKKKGGEGFSKNTISVLRTKLRNNIELTTLADGKANVLLSLNALMLTFILPFMIPYMDQIKEEYLFIPLVILISTCLATVCISVIVLRPGKFGGQGVQIQDRSQVSPFFFGNFGLMSKGEYLNYSNEVLNNDKLVNKFLSNDFYHIGMRLAEKMKLIRIAFNVFIVGLIVSTVLTLLLIFIM